jgi:hypothetical protein
MSAILPGLGQAYNKKYWKMPIIYAGAGAVFYFIKFNSGYYKDYKDAYSNRILGIKDKYPQYTEDNLIELRDYYRRNLELTYILGGVLYLLNILDASVDANLYDYNINENLSLNLNPYWNPTYNNNLNFALKLSLKF